VTFQVWCGKCSDEWRRLRGRNRGGRTPIDRCHNGDREFYLPCHLRMGLITRKFLAWKGSADIFELGGANGLLIQPREPKGRCTRGGGKRTHVVTRGDAASAIPGVLFSVACRLGLIVAGDEVFGSSFAQITECSSPHPAQVRQILESIFKPLPPSFRRSPSGCHEFSESLTVLEFAGEDGIGRRSAGRYGGGSDLTSAIFIGAVGVGRISIAMVPRSSRGRRCRECGPWWLPTDLADLSCLPGEVGAVLGGSWGGAGGGGFFWLHDVESFARLFLAPFVSR